MWYPEISPFHSDLDGASHVTRKENSDIGSTFTFRGLAVGGPKEIGICNCFRSLCLFQIGNTKYLIVHPQKQKLKIKQVAQMTSSSLLNNLMRNKFGFGSNHFYTLFSEERLEQNDYTYVSLILFLFLTKWTRGRLVLSTHNRLFQDSKSNSEIFILSRTIFFIFIQKLILIDKQSKSDICSFICFLFRIFYFHKRSLTFNFLYFFFSIRNFSDFVWVWIQYNKLDV